MEKKERPLFYFEDRALPIVRTGSVLANLTAHKIEIDHSCGGFATCGTCRIIVDNAVDDIPPRNEAEAQFAEERGFADNERLACQLRCQSDLRVMRPPYFFKTKKGFE